MMAKKFEVLAVLGEWADRLEWHACPAVRVERGKRTALAQAVFVTLCEDPTVVVKFYVDPDNLEPTTGLSPEVAVVHDGRSALLTLPVDMSSRLAARYVKLLD
jgi:hypothetical protein